MFCFQLILCSPEQVGSVKRYAVVIAEAENDVAGCVDKTAFAILLHECKAFVEIPRKIPLWLDDNLAGCINVTPLAILVHIYKVAPPTVIGQFLCKRSDLLNIIIRVPVALHLRQMLQRLAVISGIIFRHGCFIGKLRLFLYRFRPLLTVQKERN